MNPEKIKNETRFSNTPLIRKNLNDGLAKALGVIESNLCEFTDYFPSHESKNGYYYKTSNTDGYNSWNTGFWTGILWLAYELSGGDVKFRKAAERQIPSFYKRIQEKIGVNHHDMGFLYIPSCVAAYKLTGNVMAKNAALMAADHLSSRFREKGEFIQAWGNVDDESDYRLIIDCMMNIPLLYWASEVTGNMKYDEIAQKHFRTTMRNIFRDDGSSFHTFYFNKRTGEAIRGITHQGYSDDSCWARGQAWGLYGIPLTNKYHFYSETVDIYKCVANYFLNRLPEDYVPYWDMIFTEGDMPRDSSSAAIAVCGFLEMIKYIDDQESKKLYKNAADNIMYSLIENYSVAPGEKSNGLLKHSTYHYKGNLGVDECNIWGDYFYMEALTRYLKDWNLYW